MRKLRTHTKTFNRSSEELGMDPVYLEIPLTVNLDEIQSYRMEITDESFMSGNPKGDGSIIYMSSGESFWIKTEYKTLDSIMDNGNA